MNPLVTFLLEQIGVPVTAMIIKEYQTAHAGAWPTPEQVAQTFIDDVAKWTNQGNAWLLANPAK
jgi:hypothetical protein